MSGNRRRLGRRPLADHSPRKNSSALDLTGRQTKAHMDRRQLTVLVQDKERQKATTSQLREPFRRSAGALSVIIPGCDRICMPNSDRCYNRCGGALGVAGASGVSDQYGYAHAGPHEDRCLADLPEDDVMDIDCTQDNDDLDSKDEDSDVVRALCRIPGCRRQCALHYLRYCRLCENGNDHDLHEHELICGPWWIFVVQSLVSVGITATEYKRSAWFPSVGMATLLMLWLDSVCRFLEL